MLEKWIIHFTSTWWIDSEKVAPPLIFQNCFFYILFIFQIGRLFQRLIQSWVFYWIFVDKLLYTLLNLVAWWASKYIWTTLSSQSCSLDTIPKIWFLRFVIKPFHSMLYFIQWFLFPVESFDTHQIKCICYKVRFDRHIKWWVTCHRRAQIHLKKPRFKIRVNKDIETQNFKAVGSMSAIFLHSILHIIFSTK